MGALTRATRKEVAALSEAEWGDLMSRVGGGESLKEICGERSWAYGALWRWIRADEKLSSAYDEAKKAQAELAMDEVLPLVDGTEGEVADRKLRADARFKVAGKWDRGRYGEQVKVSHSGMMPVLNILVVGEAGVGEKEIEAVEGDLGALPAEEIEELEGVNERV